VTWVNLIILILQVVNKLIDYVQNQGLIQQGHDEEIANQALAIAKKTAKGKEIMEKIDAMSETQVDDALRGLEPRGTG
jgi:hypothetical protein